MVFVETAEFNQNSKIITEKCCRQTAPLWVTSQNDKKSDSKTSHLRSDHEVIMKACGVNAAKDPTVQCGPEVLDIFGSLGG